MNLKIYDIISAESRAPLAKLRTIKVSGAIGRFTISPGAKEHLGITDEMRILIACDEDNRLKTDWYICATSSDMGMRIKNKTSAKPNQPECYKTHYFTNKKATTDIIGAIKPTDTNFTVLIAESPIEVDGEKFYKLLFPLKK